MLGKLRRKLRLKLSGEQDIEELIKMGLKVGKNLNKQFGVTIDSSHCWLITIGDNVILAPKTYILAHDTSTWNHLGYTKIGKVSIGNNTFIGAGSIVLPNVNIGDNVIVAAGSVVTKDVPSNSLVGGNPAKFICTTEDYINRNKEDMATNPVYSHDWTVQGNITEEMKATMINQLEGKIGYVK